MIAHAGTTSDDHIRALPKVELHVHVEGAAPPHTIAELARKNGVDLGVDDPADLYRYDDLAAFLRVYDVVCRSLQHADDIHRVTYEALWVAATRAICESHGVSLRTAALRYPLTVDGVTAVIVGMSSPTEVDDNIADLQSAIPPALWTDLATQ